MRLFLLRHAQANDIWPDSQRTLTEHGEQQVAKLCRLLEKREFENIVQIWHSPYLRAARTAEIFKERMELSAPLIESSGIAPDDSPHNAARMMASISCFGGDLLAVSHNPLLENVADILLNGKRCGSKTVFRKCTVAAFTLLDTPAHESDYGSWSLDFLISPTHISD